MYKLVSKWPINQLENWQVKTLAADIQLQQENHYNIDTHGPHSDGLMHGQVRDTRIKSGSEEAAEYYPLKGVH